MTSLLGVPTESGGEALGDTPRTTALSLWEMEGLRTRPPPPPGYPGAHSTPINFLETSPDYRIEKEQLTTLAGAPRPGRKRENQHPYTSAGEEEPGAPLVTVPLRASSGDPGEHTAFARPLSLQL